MNVPNILTVLRFILVPFFGYSLYGKHYIAAVILFTIGGLTDILDGYIARKYNMITPWGKVADPLADKFMQVTALALLTFHKVIPMPVLLVVVAKEIFIGIGSILLYKKENTVVAANWYGKLATVIFYFAIVMAIILGMDRFSNTYTDTIVNVFVGIAVVATLFAFFMYSLKYRRLRQDSN